MTQQSKAYYTVGAVGQMGRGGREQEQVTDHIPKKGLNILHENCSKVRQDWMDRVEVVWTSGIYTVCLPVTQG